MKFLSFFIFFSLLSPPALAKAPDSEVSGLSLRNSMAVGDDTYGEALIIRSSQPRSQQHFDELEDLGIKDVIIFKTDTRGEVIKEIVELEKRKIATHHIPFKWADHDSFSSVCKQTIDALRVIKESRTKETKALLHCSHGEDRTGYLAAVIQLLDDSDDIRENFESQMCEGGYGSGNPDKPSYVVNKIRKATTNLYLRMAWKIQRGKISWDNLSKNTCSYDPQRSASFRNSEDHQPASYICETSSRW